MDEKLAGEIYTDVLTPYLDENNMISFEQAKTVLLEKQVDLKGYENNIPELFEEMDDFFKYITDENGDKVKCLKVNKEVVRSVKPVNESKPVEQKPESEKPAQVLDEKTAKATNSKLMSALRILERECADGNGFVFVVDFVQQQPVRHAEFGTAQQLLALQLEEDDGDGLVHPGGEELVLLGVLLGVQIGHLDAEAAGVAVPVDLVGEDTQGPQGNAVASLDDVEIVVADGIAEHRGHQGPRARGGAHPQDIVVAPLDVHAPVAHQAVHDDVRPGTTVEDIADDVQMVHGQGLDGGAHGLDHIGGLADGDDGVDEVLEIVFLGAVLVTDVDQLVQDLPVALGHLLPDMVAGVLDGDEAADLDQTVEGDAVPLVQVLLAVRHQLQLGLGVRRRDRRRRGGDRRAGAAALLQGGVPQADRGHENCHAEHGAGSRHRCHHQGVCGRIY